MTPVIPFCLSRASDVPTFERIATLMNLSTVREAGVLAFARCLHTAYNKQGAKSRLMALMAPRHNTEARWETITGDHPYHLLEELWNDAKIGQAFRGELPYISSHSAWIYTDASFVVMQAEHIVQQIRNTIPPSVARLENLTITRSTCATLRYVPPASAHDLLHLTVDAGLAIKRLSSLTQPALDALAAYGYHVATPKPEDLRAGISNS